jgi:ABC-2 type transport system permease protein
VATERQALVEGDRDLVIIIPPNFSPSAAPVELDVLYNEGRPQEAQVGQVIIRQILDELTFRLTGASRLFTIDAQPVNSRNLGLIDFLMPGIIALSIMQMGLFSVAFAFVQLKKQGILRRLLATPIQPASFLFAQVFTRLVVSIFQTLVIIGVAVLFFDVHLIGSIFAILALALIGGALFISMGFAISGWAKSEEVAAPVANIIALPMMFLSGVFFPRDAMPQVLQTITDYLPLTYLAEAMRSVAIDGATLWSQWLNLIGLGVWLALSFLVAVWLFRWE